MAQAKRALMGSRWLLALALLLMADPIPAAGGELGRTEIILQSQLYYARWDLTRLTYRVSTHPHAPLPAFWVLEAQECLSDASIDRDASSPYVWESEPFRGLRFPISQRTQHFYLWLTGEWGTGSLRAAVANEGGGTSIGAVDGPHCLGSAISVIVVRGASVAFPPLLAAGRLAGDTATQLRVTSTSSGWTLDHHLSFDIPPGAEEDVVSRVFSVQFGTYAAKAGTTEIDVSYALTIEPEDLAGLPEGVYSLAIAFTVSAGD